MKRLMLVLNGILPPEASKENRPAETVLKEVSGGRGQWQRINESENCSYNYGTKNVYSNIIDTGL